jgi:cellulose synthase/poly-beta-1,6-N-acetylglucosamine synthase-like glycosyltransferase
MEAKPRSARHLVLVLLALIWVVATASSIRYRDLTWLQYLRIDLAWLQALLLVVGLYGTLLLVVGTFFRSRARSVAVSPDDHFVSIVVPAKNEESVIAPTLRGLCALDFAGSSGAPRYEVIVVDDRSTDGTGAVLARLSAELPIRVLRTGERSIGKAAALNLATSQARGDLIAVFDADARVAPDYLRLMLSRLSDERVAGVQGRRAIYNSMQNQLTRKQDEEYRLFLHAVQLARQIMGGMVTFVGNGLLLRREALADAGGWNEEALTEDVDLSMRLQLAGWEIMYCEDAVVWEEAVSTLREYVRQRTRWVEGGMFCLGEHLPAIVFGRTGVFRRLDMVLFLTGSLIFAMSMVTSNLFGVPRLLGSLVLYLQLPWWLTRLVWVGGSAVLLVSALRATRGRFLDALMLLVRFAGFSVLTPLCAVIAGVRYVRRAMTGTLVWEKTAHGVSDAARSWVAAGTEDEG